MMNHKRSANYGHFGYLCPFPDCGHIGDFITKAHCEIEHGMEREEIYKKYGHPKEIRFDMRALEKNTKLGTGVSGYEFD